MIKRVLQVFIIDQEDSLLLFDRQERFPQLTDLFCESVSNLTRLDDIHEGISVWIVDALENIGIRAAHFGWINRWSESQYDTRILKELCCAWMTVTKSWQYACTVLTAVYS